MKIQSKTIVLIAPCCMDRTDCFARNSRGGCMALTFTDFKEGKCSFYKTAAQEIQDRAAAVERLERLGRRDLIEKHRLKRDLARKGGNENG